MTIDGKPATPVVPAVVTLSTAITHRADTEATAAVAETPPGKTAAVAH